MKRSIFAFFLVLTVATMAMAYSNNLPQGYAGDPPAMNNCTTCHSSFPVNSGDGEIIFTQLTEYTPGLTYELDLEMQDLGQLRWGFQITAKDNDNNFVGVWTITEPSFTQLNGNYVNHTSAGTYDGQEDADWAFDWTAPAAGTGDITFYIAGNAANSNNNTMGDYIYTTAIPVAEATQDPYTFVASPINTTVPAGGGSISYSLELTTTFPQTFPGVTYWTTVTLPNGNEFGPVFQVTTTVPANADIFIPELVQMVPGTAPAGNYAHNSKIGYYPAAVATSSFGFTKSALAADGAAWVDDWAVHADWPNASGEGSAEVVTIPKEYSLDAAYPNPFNALTRVAVRLPETSELSVAVYNVLGEQVAELASGAFSAGNHTFTFDADGMSSGIYFVRAQVPGKLNKMQKITLIK